MKNAIREDALQFLLPAFFVFSAGMVVSAWDLVRHQERLFVPSVQSVIGTVLVFLGLTLAIIAAINLRRSYSSTLVIRDDHQLVTHGTYRFVRHPIYLGVLLAIIGIPVFASSLYGLATMIFLVPLILHRITMEERLLTEAYGDAYRVYKAATRKLLPFVY